MPLEYVGNGKHITGLPASDLSDLDIERYATNARLTSNAMTKILIDSGLYKAPPKPKASKVISVKDSE